VKTVEEQLALIRRGVEHIVPEDELRRKLERSVKTGKPLRVKYGIDPTGFEVHLGHTVPLRKLRLFQELGHKAVLILGDYTARVGDPSGRDESRKGLTEEQIEANARGYLTQIGRIIDVSRAEVRRNGEWFGKFSFADVLALTGQITVQRMQERDDFTNRIKAGTPIYLSECLYPLMQGRDSVEIQADVELGGSEQLYNLLVGRDLQSKAGQEPQICLTMPILRGLDGEKKMGKSLGNYIGVGEQAQSQFDKTMSITDTLMREWFELLTDRPAEEIARLVDPQATHPMAAKKLLAGDIVRCYHGAAAAKAAEAEWVKRFSNKEDPDVIPEVVIPAAELSDGKLWISKVLTLLGWVKSNNEARRAVEGGGVNVGPERTKITDWKANIPITDGLIVRYGSRRVARLRVR
jgi:tyrosyl-tRNA synthetase